MQNRKLTQKIIVLLLSALGCWSMSFAAAPQVTTTTTQTTPPPTSQNSAPPSTSTTVTQVTPAQPTTNVIPIPPITPEDVNLPSSTTTTTNIVPTANPAAPTAIATSTSTSPAGTTTAVSTAVPNPDPADTNPYSVTPPTTTVTTITAPQSSVPSMIIIPDNQSLGAMQTYTESEETMLNSAPPGPTPSPDEQEAFNLMMKQVTPLSSKQIIRLHQLIDASQRAASIPANVPPKPVSTTLIMNLAPGATPPAIRLAKGYVSSLVFVDSTGAAWPIASYEIGDPKTSNIQWDGKSNILLIQASTPYGVSDLVVSLVGLMTPLTLELVSGQRVVDYRTDIHVSGIGPNTKVIPTGTNLPNSANQLLLSVLDGIAPDGSKPLTIRGGDCQGWLLGDKMYLRTRLTLLSPGWVGRMVSPDGMIAYEVQRSSSILVSQYGQPIELKVEGF